MRGEAWAGSPPRLGVGQGHRLHNLLRGGDLRALRTLLADDPELHADWIGVGQLTAPGASLARPDRPQRVTAAIATSPP